MGIVSRFLDRDYHPFAPVLSILFISVARMLFEIAIFDSQANTNTVLRLFIQTSTFYLVTFFLFSLLFRLVLSRPFEKVANAVSVGLLFGLVPPLLDLVLQSDLRWQYTYFLRFTWTLLAPKQPVSESIALWGVVLGSGVFVLLLRRSILRGILGLIGAYAIFQGCSLVFLLIKGKSLLFPSHLEIWLNLAWIGISFACYMLLRGRPLLGCLMRIPHALPHALLALCGAAWVHKGISGGLFAFGVLLFLVFILIVQNDYYDAKEDALAGRKEKPGYEDIVWTNFFLLIGLLWLLKSSPVLVLILLLFFVVGCLYHHPAVRLKQRFCLSYKAEGTWALLAFLAGTLDKNGFPKDVDLFVPGLLVFAGATVVSIPKDWKDVESDRESKIPTYYVILTRKGLSELTVHKWIVACVTLCLLVPPLWLVVERGTSLANYLVFMFGLIPMIPLLAMKNKRLAVIGMMIVLALYILLLAIAIGG